jgi:hypothetical protein
VASIGGRAFWECKKLNTINFKGDVPTLGTTVFGNSNRGQIFNVPSAYFSNWHTQEVASQLYVRLDQIKETLGL